MISRKRSRLAALVSGLALTGSAAAQQPAPPLLDTGAQTIYLDAGSENIQLAGDGGRGVGPWLGLQTQTGPGVGYRDSFWTLEGFLPVYIDGVGVAFADLRAIESNTGLFSTNLGAGVRVLNGFGDRIWGANIYYDQRDTGEHTFNQLGFGFESLGAVVDFRTNIYIALGDRRRESGASFGANPTFFQHFILLDDVSYGEASLGGFDFEFGAPVPLLDRYGVKGYVGGYHYQGPGGQQIWGPKLRVETRFTDSFDADVSVSNDTEFGTSVVGRVGFRFGSRAAREGSSRGNVYARLVDRVERNEQIAIRNANNVASEVAIDPVTNTPIIVQHVASSAAAGGDGTVERPFQSLPTVVSAPRNIIFAHAGSTFTGQSITLQDNQRFLGEGIPHIFVAQQGTFLLPRATTGTVVPVITGATSNAVVLANNNEVSGFTITNSIGGASSAIFGNNIAGFNINRNTITNNQGTSAIVLTGVSGQALLTDNVITGNQNSSVTITATGGLTGGITGNNISNNTNFGLRLTGTTFTGDLANNTINNNGNTGLTWNLSGAHTGNVAGNVVGGNPGMAGILYTAASLSGNFANNTANANGNTGMNVTVTGAIGGSFSGNTANNNPGLAGIFLTAGSIGGGLSNNTANQNGNTGLRAAVTGALNGGVNGNTTNNNTGLGGLNVSAASLSGGVSNNTANSNANTGIRVAVTNAITGDISGNTANSNSGNGGLSVSAASLTGNIANNTTNLNAGNTGLTLNLTGALTGNVTGNLADNNNTGMNLTVGGLFNGNFSNNTATDSGGNTGVLLTAGGMIGQIAGNTTTGNGARGMNFTLTGNGLSNLSILNNNFSNNSAVNNQFTATNTGTGPVTIGFSGNTGQPPPAGPFNFFFNSSGGNMTVNYSATNVGSVTTLGNVTFNNVP